MNLGSAALLVSCGLVVGMVVMNFLWEAKIKEKAHNGFRLAVDKRLYVIREVR